MPIHTQKIGMFGGFDPLNGELCHLDSQKALPCVETRHMTYRSSRKERYTTKPKQVTSHVFAETTHFVAVPYGLACVVIAPDVVIYSKFHQNPFRGFEAPGGRNLLLPITLAIGFYSSLHRASRNITLDNLSFLEICFFCFFCSSMQKPQTTLFH